MSGDNMMELTLARVMPGWVRWALHGLVFGLALCINLYVANHVLVYVLTGVSFGITYLFTDFYNRWANLHNANLFKELAAELPAMLAEFMDERKSDGTFTDDDGLTKGSDTLNDRGSDEYNAEEDSSTDGE